MNELITTLEQKEDLGALLESSADLILISIEGMSSSAAQKLTLEELEVAAAKIHESGKKIAVLANLTFHEGLLSTAENGMEKMKSLGVDAIFFADPALYYLAKKYDMVGTMIYDPETLLTSSNDANWWVQRGLQGITISPLLTLTETEEITEAAKKAVVTVYGRTLMSRSYRKLLSAYQAQYERKEDLAKARNLNLIETSRPDAKMPVYEDETGTLIYSDDVLETFDFIENIVKCGPLGLLINGSYIPLKEQIAALSAYRRILDGEAPSTVGKEYREQFHTEPLDSGYYEQKTVK